MVIEKKKNVKNDFSIFGLNNQKDRDMPTSDEGYSLKQVFLFSYFIIVGKDQNQCFGNIEMSTRNSSKD